MTKMAKNLMVLCMPLVFCVGLPSAFSGSSDINLEFRGQMMSADLQGTPLRLVLEKLAREKGIWFKGDESVLEGTVSLGFKDLPVQEGLRRILSGVNHVLFFDQDTRLVGLYILGTGEFVDRGRPDTRIAREKPFSPRPLEGTPVGRNPFEAALESSPLGKAKGQKSTGDVFSPPQGQDSEGINAPPSDNTRRVKNPFIEGVTSAENPFIEDIPPPAGKRSDDNRSPSSENPFIENVPPQRENPFVDRPFGVSR